MNIYWLVFKFGFKRIPSNVRPIDEPAKCFVCLHSTSVCYLFQHKLCSHMPGRMYYSRTLTGERHGYYVDYDVVAGNCLWCYVYNETERYNYPQRYFGASTITGKLFALLFTYAYWFQCDFLSSFMANANNDYVNENERNRGEKGH